MAPERASRKLTAILSADVKGYSRLMREDELATVDTLKAYRELMSTLIQKYRGRVVDSPGDNVLAEFTSVVDGVECAVEIQKELKAKNSDLPENRRMGFRIGINLGDVIQDEDRIYGDGVNIAARVEGLAEPGGLCISGSAFEQVKGKLALGYESLGEHTVKNIAEPVRVYRVLMEPEAAGRVVVEKRPALKRWQWVALSAAVVAIAVVAIWYFAFRPSYPPVEPAFEERMVFPLPDKPSLAVLPFDNLGGDPEQEYFSDGMTDDLITDLSKISGLFVIARNSTFAYKGKPIKIRQVAEDLGVRYVLEGSVRRVAERVRINAQLIDATTGGHLWAERYDGDLDDIFDLQDKITQKIVSALAVKLTLDEEEQAAQKYTTNVAAYDNFLQGWAHYVRFTPEDHGKAYSYFEKAIELDPNYGRAYAALALTVYESRWRGWRGIPSSAWITPSEWEEEYFEPMMKNPTSLGYHVASRFLILWHRHNEAIGEAEHAITLDPNDPNGYVAMAYALIYGGRPKEAINYIKKAMRIDPEYPANYLFVLGLASFGMEEFEEAAALFERAQQRNPENWVPLLFLSATYAHLGREPEAKAAIADLDKLAGDMGRITMGDVLMRPWSKYKDPADTHRLLDGLNKAGLASTKSLL